MAEALGYPATPIGFSDILALAQDPAGWAGKGHPEWGPFRSARRTPTSRRAGSPQTVAQYYAATGKTSDLTLEDLARPEVEAFARGVESAVVHYGDTTLTFLNNLYRADRRGDPYGYASAVAVEEKSVARLQPRQPRRHPRSGREAAQARASRSSRSTRRKARSSPTTRSSSSTRRGCRRAEAAAARKFADVRDRAQEPAPRAQVRVPPRQPRGRDRQADHRGERRRPEPAPDHARGAEAAGARRRDRRVEPGPQEGAGAARRSTSRARWATRPTPDSGDTKLDLAKKAAIAALGQFQPEDEVGLAHLLDRHQRQRADRLPRRRADRPDVGEPRRPREPDRAARARPRARRSTRSTEDSYTKMRRRVRPDPHQRRRAPHRRPQRGPAQRETSTDLLEVPAGAERGRDDQAGPDLHRSRTAATPTRRRSSASPRRRTRPRTAPSTPPRSSTCSTRWSATSDHGCRRQAPGAVEERRRPPTRSWRRRRSCSPASAPPPRSSAGSRCSPSIGVGALAWLARVATLMPRGQAGRAHRPDEHLRPVARVRARGARRAAPLPQGGQRRERRADARPTRRDR